MEEQQGNEQSKQLGRRGEVRLHEEEWGKTEEEVDESKAHSWWNKVDNCGPCHGLVVEADQNMRLNIGRKK